MVRTFGKVIGISVGIVAVVFLIVATILYRSGGNSEVAERTEALSTADSSFVMHPQPAPRKLEVTIEHKQPPPKAPDKSVKAKPQRTTASAMVATRSTSTVRNQTSPSSPSKGKMTPEEYVEREMYYVGKIGDESAQVLKRSADDRARLDAYKAELESLQNPNDH